jgi:hypothetical protein
MLQAWQQQQKKKLQQLWDAGGASAGAKVAELELPPELTDTVLPQLAALMDLSTQRRVAQGLHCSCTCI